VNADDRPSKGKSRLVALSTVALIAVYAAGYARTRAAADRFAGADAERRPAPPVNQPGRNRDTTALPSSAVAVATVPPPIAAVKRDTPKRETRVIAAPIQSIDSAVPTVATTVVAGAVPPVDTSRPVIVGQNVDSIARAADKLRSQYKDGVYTGWGTSRHGDIQASVEIKDGRIVAASIAQCLTRYSCSWISHLPGQIIARQAADVDLVSGATQSTNAFYYAIVEALSKAK